LAYKFSGLISDSQNQSDWLVWTFLKPLGDRVNVQTIRQNKGSQAGVILLSVQPRHACEREPEGSMVDTGKLVVALAEHDRLFGCSLVAK